MRCDLDRQKQKFRAAFTYSPDDDGAELENIWLIVNRTAAGVPFLMTWTTHLPSASQRSAAR